MQSNDVFFRMEKLYVKGISLEMPSAPDSFMNDITPQVTLDIDYSTTKIKANTYEVVLSSSIKMQLEKSEDIILLFEADQAGIFILKNIPTNKVDSLLGIECNNILFPYLRELVTSTTARAGFMPIILDPVNFAYLYEKKTNKKIN